MSARKIDLQTELERLTELRRQTEKALCHVRELLERADSSGTRIGSRRWRGIVDNLERTLVRIRASLTFYDQQIKDVESRLRKSSMRGGVPAESLHSKPKLEAQSANEVEAVERLLAMPLSELAKLTLEEVSAMHEQLCAAREPADKKTPEPAAPQKTALSSRIEQAKKTRESLLNMRKKINEPFMERRMQAMMQSGFEKLVNGKRDQLHLEELEAMVECQKRLMGKPRLTDEEVKTKYVLDSAIADIQSRAAMHRSKGRK